MSPTTVDNGHILMNKIVQHLTILGSHSHRLLLSICVPQNSYSEILAPKGDEISRWALMSYGISAS